MTKTVNLDPPIPTMLTHKGWFGFCPIYLGDVHSDAPIVIVRYEWLWPLMTLSQWFQMALVFVQTFPFGGDAGWLIAQGKELKEPKWIMSDGSVM